MITVNLKDLYYWCKEDIFVGITEEMLEAMKAADRQESAEPFLHVWAFTEPITDWRNYCESEIQENRR